MTRVHQQRPDPGQANDASVTSQLLARSAVQGLHVDFASTIGAMQDIPWQGTTPAQGREKLFVVIEAVVDLADSAALAPAEQRSQGFHLCRASVG